MRGPIDFIIVSFKGPKFDGSILQALGDALDKGVIGLVALLVIRKDAEGAISTIDVTQADDKQIADFVGQHPPQNDKVDQDDLDEVAELLEPDSAAALLMIEHQWAIPLKQAIVDAKGVLLADGRINQEAAQELDTVAA